MKRRVNKQGDMQKRKGVKRKGNIVEKETEGRQGKKMKEVVSKQGRKEKECQKRRKKENKENKMEENEGREKM